MQSLQIQKLHLITRRGNRKGTVSIDPRLNCSKHFENCPPTENLSTKKSSEACVLHAVNDKNKNVRSTL